MTSLNRALLALALATATAHAATNIKVTPRMTMTESTRKASVVQKPHRNAGKTALVGVAQTNYYVFSQMDQGFDLKAGDWGTYQGHGTSGTPTITGVSSSFTIVTICAGDRTGRPC
jgi:hypothetical protein